MRLLVAQELLASSVKKYFRIPFNGYSFIPFRRLRHASYPDVQIYKLVDFLWMATESDDEWAEVSMDMTYRLRYSASDPEEFSQAAATQVVFHECGAIRQSIKSRAMRAQNSA